MDKRMCQKSSISHQNSYVRKILHSAANHPSPLSLTLNTQAWLSCKQSANLVALMQLMEKSLRKTQWPCLACFLRARWGHCQVANSPGKASGVLLVFPSYFLSSRPTFFTPFPKAQVYPRSHFHAANFRMLISFWFLNHFFFWIDLCFAWIVLPFWWRVDFYFLHPQHLIWTPGM